nr:hypothetical protein Itr_chr05CG11210 [Ipomoea trifida]
MLSLPDGLAETAVGGEGSPGRKGRPRTITAVSTLLPPQKQGPWSPVCYSVPPLTAVEARRGEERGCHRRSSTLPHACCFSSGDAATGASWSVRDKGEARRGACGWSEREKKKEIGLGLENEQLRRRR